jgi:hypothetical protein
MGRGVLRELRRGEAAPPAELAQSAPAAPADTAAEEVTVGAGQDRVSVK